MSDGETAAAPSFGEAMAELEAILRRIEGEEVDVDRLAEELRRAAELLELCRAKIRKAEVEVTQIVQTLEGQGGEAGAPGTSAGDEDEPDDEDEDEDDDEPEGDTEPDDDGGPDGLF
jgi:exodeoxyribonuclease VII small subunit